MSDEIVRWNSFRIQHLAAIGAKHGLVVLVELPQVVELRRQSNGCSQQVAIFVPWYLLRDKDITLRDLAEYKQIGDLPQSLKSWVDGQPKNWGHERYQLMLELYVYLELCLSRRYGDRLNRNRERLDIALSRYYCVRRGHMSNPARLLETIRKTRQEMNHRLRSSRND